MSHEVIFREMHPMLIHYPIAILSFALVMDFMHYFFNAKTQPFAEWTIAVGCVAFIPAIITGFLAASEVPADTALADHQNYAYILLTLSFLYTTIRIGSVVEDWSFPPALYISVGLLITIFLILTGLSGSRIIRDPNCIDNKITTEESISISNSNKKISTTIRHSLAELHRMIIHYPIALFTYALALDFLAYFFNFNTKPFAEWTIGFGALTFIPAIITGLFAVAELPAELSGSSIVSAHQTIGYTLITLVFLYAVLRLGSLIEEWTFPANLYISIGLLIVLALFFSAKTGTEIVEKTTECKKGEPFSVGSKVSP